MLISAAVDILACELGIFNLKIGKNIGVLALGMVPFTGTSYIREKNAARGISGWKTPVDSGIAIQF
jgi:cell division GTPase FtsZ